MKKYHWWVLSFVTFVSKWFWKQVRNPMFSRTFRRIFYGMDVKVTSEIIPNKFYFQWKFRTSSDMWCFFELNQNLPKTEIMIWSGMNFLCYSKVISYSFEHSHWISNCSQYFISWSLLFLQKQTRCRADGTFIFVFLFLASKGVYRDGHFSWRSQRTHLSWFSGLIFNPPYNGTLNLETILRQ